MLEGIAGPPDQAALATPGSGPLHRERMLRRAQHRVVRRDGGRQRDAARVARARRAAARSATTCTPTTPSACAAASSCWPTIWWAAGAREILVPLAGVPALRDGDSGPLRARRVRPRDVKAMAFHPLGTARAGADPARSVVDPELQVHGVRGPLRRRRQRGALVAAGQPADHDHGPGGPPGARAGGGARRRLCQDARVIARSDAVAALRAERFDVVVVGGGITGAGVALDAATRGYSVALVEKADYASGTSSRSSKLVHGGLRYLQNFDLGPRARGAARAPAHGQRWRRTWSGRCRFVVPAFDGARPDRMVGVGLNLYDVDGAAAAAPRAAATASCGARAPPRDRRRRGRRAAAGAGRPRADLGLPVLRLPDRRQPPRPHRAGRGRALRRGLRQPRSRSPSCSTTAAARAASACATR